MERGGGKGIVGWEKCEVLYISYLILILFCKGSL